MKKELKNTQESTIPVNYLYVPEQTERDKLTKCYKQRLHHISITPLCVLLFFGQQNKCMAEENTVSLKNTESTTEVILKSWRVVFPIIGSSYCKVDRAERMCRKDGKPVTSYSYKIYSSHGWGTSITNINQDGNCVIVHYRLSVDHVGPEGSACLEAYADLDIQLILNYESGFSPSQH